MNASRSIAPKKSFSQNFLTDKGIAKRIVDACEIQEGQCVVEIGPGSGALTGFLLEQCSDLLCIELDRRAVEVIRSNFHAREGMKFECREGDFLELDFEALKEDRGDRISVIGNIPYAISSPIIFHLYDHAPSIRCAVLMMQKEVARRLTASPHSKDYGVLSLATQMIGRVKRVCDVQPGSFFPRPSVQSSVVRIDFEDRGMSAEEMTELRRLIRAAFGQRRKMLRNALADLVNTRYPNALTAESVYWEKRAEDLSLADYRSLAEFLSQFAAKK